MNENAAPRIVEDLKDQRITRQILIVKLVREVQRALDEIEDLKFRFEKLLRSLRNFT